MSADIDHQAAASRRTRFWVVPLVAGCCFSLGYGITHRLMAMQSSVREIKPESFVPQSFPGNSLGNLRSRSGDRSPLQVDLAAIDAREAAEKTPQLQAKPILQGFCVLGSSQVSWLLADLLLNVVVCLGVLFSLGSVLRCVVKRRSKCDSRSGFESWAETMEP